MSGPIAADIDAYIAGFPSEVQLKLQELRATIAKAAPMATEAIKYAMPTFVQDGNLVHFAGYKNHIGFYPAPAGIANFEKELKPYVTSKGAIQFPMDQKIPLSLVTKIVKFRIKDNQDQIAAKQVSKKSSKKTATVKSAARPAAAKPAAAKAVSTKKKTTRGKK
ncbi:MAG: hypothetical protein EOO02_06300 [Chitinophagaceae bacterium]|nr:MAG: hypothetical protein EOO02_06300 [Chitinophagaceae bacterium]